MGQILVPLILTALVAAVFLSVAWFLERHREALRARNDATRRYQENMTFLTQFTSKLGTVEEAPQALQLVAHHLANECDAESLAIFVDEAAPGGGRVVRGAAVAGLLYPRLFPNVEEVILEREPA